LLIQGKKLPAGERVISKNLNLLLTEMFLFTNFFEMDLMVLLFLTNFIRTLFIIVVIYYGFRFISRYVFPFLLDKGIKNMQNKVYEQQRQSQRATRQPGEVTVENKGQNRSVNQNKGEYVDFEEVE
jgi:Domain of unknown function (DUF4834)